MKTLADALPDEIMRVLKVRDLYLSLPGMPNVMVEHVIALMAADIERAVRALYSGDVVEMLRVYESLKGYEA